MLRSLYDQVIVLVALLLIPPAAYAAPPKLVFLDAFHSMSWAHEPAGAAPVGGSLGSVGTGSFVHQESAPEYWASLSVHEDSSRIQANADLWSTAAGGYFGFDPAPVADLSRTDAVIAIEVTVSAAATLELQTVVTAGGDPGTNADGSATAAVTLEVAYSKGHGCEKSDPLLVDLELLAKHETQLSDKRTIFLTPYASLCIRANAFTWTAAPLEYLDDGEGQPYPVGFTSGESLARFFVDLKILE